jgi:hypothetical protein
MLSKLALSQLLCLVAVKETIHEEDRWEQISDQHELERLHHLDLMPNEELLERQSLAFSINSVPLSIGSCGMSASVTDVASSCHPLAKGVQKHACHIQFIHQLKPVVFMWEIITAPSRRSRLFLGST